MQRTAPTKILHCVNAFAPDGPGGVETYAGALAAAQRARGHEVVVLAGSGRRAATTRLEPESRDGLRVHRLVRDDLFFDHYAKLWHPEAGRLFDELLERERPDVVHVQHWMRLTTDLVLRAEARGIATVVSLHDFLVSCPRCFRVDRDGAPCSRPLAPESCVGCVPRFGHERADELEVGIELHRRQFLAELDQAGAVLAISDFVAHQVAAGLAFPRERITTLALPYAPHGLRRPATPPDRPLRFAYWGRLAPHKGVVELVAAFTRALAARPGAAAELHLLGAFADGAIETPMRALAGSAPVVFHGPFTFAELAALAPDFGVFPSTCLETHGYVLDECFELGLPALLSDSGAPAQRAGAGALIHRAGDVAALARDLGRCLDEPQLREQLAAARPPPPPTFADHAAALDAIYGELRARSSMSPRRGSFLPPTAAERLRFLQLQRESALERCCPEGGPR
ncbi:MAG: glycosyltransferase [Planctomycetes bacterium]|nr:glycosyltransferase [Planctomycetota bacterium]